MLKVYDKLILLIVEYGDTLQLSKIQEAFLTRFSS